ncbi:MAG: AmmeMemoRadiSam system protein B [Chloroflexota bacterium]|nr:AmmeMemoRadiSam system protein B [Chloroflexota bacterium]
MSKKTDLRPSPIAGQWYPGNASRLRNSVDGYMNAAKLPKIDGEIIALITPHAGHTYSGPVAGHAFAAVRGLCPELVVVISPMHQPYSAPLLTSAHDAYNTPLGPIPIDKQAVQSLSEQIEAELGYGITPVRNDSEHSVEIELPFLQQALGKDFELLPLMLRNQTRTVTALLGHALAQTLEERDYLIVASTDLSHFHSQETARTLDQEFLKRVEAFDPDAILRGEKEGKTSACGRGAVAATLWAAKHLGADTVKVVNYATSGDITGDLGRVVGYGAAVITRTCPVET